MIDFVVTDTVGSGSSQGGGAVGESGGGGQSAQSTISRYACRIMCERSAPYTARIYAAGFDSSKNIFLGVSCFPFRVTGFSIMVTKDNHNEYSRDMVVSPTGDYVAVRMVSIWELRILGKHSRRSLILL